MPATDPFRSPGHGGAPSFLAAICASALSLAPAAAEETHQLRGLFCSTEARLDEALEHMSRNLDPHAAVERTNVEDVACTYVDRLHYLVERPRIIGQVLAEIPLLKYEGELVGVIIGDRVRPVVPAARVFFVIDRHLPGAVAERRV